MGRDKRLRGTRSSGENTPALMGFTLGPKLGRESFPSPHQRRPQCDTSTATSIWLWAIQGTGDCPICHVWMFSVKDTLWNIHVIFMFIFHVPAKLLSVKLASSQSSLPILLILSCWGNV